MKTVFLFFAITLAVTASSQTDPVLEKYLAGHRSVINIRPDSTLSLSPEAAEMISACMKGKSLFVLAENTSHEMELYRQLRPALIRQFLKMNLKYVFLEWGRSVAYCLNAYLDDNYKMADQYFFDIDERRRVKDAIGNKRTFSYVGLDFERGLEFNTAVNNLFYDVDMNSLHESRNFIANLKDISSAQVPPDSNGKVYYTNFHNFYKQTQNDFFRDIALFKRELGPKYLTLAYLLSNPNQQLPPPWTRPWLINHGRNPELARNLLDEVSPLDTTAVYFLSTGAAHAEPKRGQFVSRVSRSKTLKNRVVIMNEYCEHCFVDGEEKGNLPMFLKGDVLTTFRNAANGELVLFDLTQLPEEYAFIKRHGGLLLFAKNQH